MKIIDELFKALDIKIYGNFLIYNFMRGKIYKNKTYLYPFL